MTENDNDFCTALDKLRRDRTRALFGLAILKNLGPYLIMGDTVLERIAERARAHKLTSLDDLYRETQWDQTWELGEQVLELMSRFIPALPKTNRLVRLSTVLEMFRSFEK